ncbi:phage tail protein [Acinetobacter sp. WZC-1]|uniref:phage tail protein n=1 Tax=Acinetobacter sp. WZC-1 TaxID=3459034 RepID=UPI00403DCA8E
MIAMTDLKLYLQKQLPHMTADKCHLLIVNGSQKEGYMEYTARLLFIDYRGDPIKVIMLIRQWLRSKNLHLDAAKNELPLTFSSEVIDTQTFDLEVDFPQRDKIVICDDEVHICPELVWSDRQGKFIAAGTE